MSVTKRCLSIAYTSDIILRRNKTHLSGVVGVTEGKDVFLFIFKYNPDFIRRGPPMPGIPVVTNNIFYDMFMCF